MVSVMDVIFCSSSKCAKYWIDQARSTDINERYYIKSHEQIQNSKLVMATIPMVLLTLFTYPSEAGNGKRGAPSLHFPDTIILKSCQKATKRSPATASPLHAHLQISGTLYYRRKKCWQEKTFQGHFCLDSGVALVFPCQPASDPFSLSHSQSYPLIHTLLLLSSI
jgi:hypothetical protein